MKTFLLSLMLCCGLAQAQTLKSGVFDPPRAAPEIALPASTGKPFKLSSLRGKVVVLEFGFTHCPYICPTSLATLVQARELLGPRGADVQVVFITVDPERDTQERLRSYLAKFDPGFIGVTGSPEQIAALLRDYGISANKRPMGDGKNYGIDHSSYLYFIDRRGMQRSMMPFGRPASDLAHDLAILLKK